jgi:CRISPR/Cas system-associated exonuclease Cas4 (RecB family)
MPYRGKYNKESEDSYKISRTAIENFVSCPRCFYLSRRLKIDQPTGAPFTLNSAVDHLLKKEFDIHRKNHTPHPLMVENHIDALPFEHQLLDEWRNNFHGVQYLHTKTNFLVYGAVDDVWVNPTGELIVVDYKATSKNDEVNLDAAWQMSYKRQMEVYQWLLRKNGFTVSDTGYFVYCNGKKDGDVFDSKLEFDMKVLPYTGNDNWIENTLSKMKEVLENEVIPEFTENCAFCTYQINIQALH